MSETEAVIPTVTAVREEFCRRFVAKAAVSLAYKPCANLDELLFFTLRQAARSATRGMGARGARALLAREATRIQELRNEHDWHGPPDPDFELLEDIREALHSGTAAFAVKEAADILLWLSFSACSEEEKKLRERASSAHGRMNLLSEFKPS